MRVWLDLRYLPCAMEPSQGSPAGSGQDTGGSAALSNPTGPHLVSCTSQRCMWTLFCFSIGTGTACTFASIGTSQLALRTFCIDMCLPGRLKQWAPYGKCWMHYRPWILPHPQ